MIYTSTLDAHSGKCPHCGVDVTVIGWYREREPGVWTFLRAECPIIENSKLPYSKQSEQYKYLRCKGIEGCPLYIGFRSKITQAE